MERSKGKVADLYFEPIDHFCLLDMNHSELARARRDSEVDDASQEACIGSPEGLDVQRVSATDKKYIAEEGHTISHVPRHVKSYGGRTGGGYGWVWL